MSLKKSTETSIPKLAGHKKSINDLIHLFAVSLVGGGKKLEGFLSDTDFSALNAAETFKVIFSRHEHGGLHLKKVSHRSVERGEILLNNKPLFDKLGEGETTEMFLSHKKYEKPFVWSMAKKSLEHLKALLESYAFNKLSSSAKLKVLLNNSVEERWTPTLLEICIKKSPTYIKTLLDSDAIFSMTPDDQKLLLNKLNIHGQNSVWQSLGKGSETILAVLNSRVFKKLDSKEIESIVCYASRKFSLNTPLSFNIEEGSPNNTKSLIKNHAFGKLEEKDLKKCLSKTNEANKAIFDIAVLNTENTRHMETLLSSKSITYKLTDKSFIKLFTEQKDIYYKGVLESLSPLISSVKYGSSKNLGVLLDSALFSRLSTKTKVDLLSTRDAVGKGIFPILKGNKEKLKILQESDMFLSLDKEQQELILDIDATVHINEV